MTGEIVPERRGGANVPRHTVCTSGMPGFESMGSLWTKVLLAGALVAVLAGQAGGHRPPRVVRLAPGAATIAGCTDAAIREVRFARDITIDQIRVQLHDFGSVPQAPVRVQVSSGPFARRLWATPDGGQALLFSPGLRGDRFLLTLDPTFEVAAPSACVARVDLLSGGTVVASIQP
jgi:hypothetical protein